MERTYIIPLRKAWLKTVRYKRAKKAVSAVKKFLVRHMKSDNVKLGNHLNHELWKHGIKNPPGKIKVNVLKDNEGLVTAELFGKEMPKQEKPAEEKKGLAKVLDKVTGNKTEKLPATQTTKDVDVVKKTETLPAKQAPNAQAPVPVKKAAPIQSTAPQKTPAAQKPAVKAPEKKK